MLDPRALVWISAGVFFAGYIVWELLECSLDREARNTNRAFTHEVLFGDDC